MDLAALAGLVEQPKKVGKQIVFLCPNHRELCASAEMQGGRLVLSCDSGCTERMLLMGLGIDATVLQGQKDTGHTPGDAGSTPAGSTTTAYGGRHGAAGDPPTAPPEAVETPSAVSESTGAGADEPAHAQPPNKTSAVPPPPVKALEIVEAQRLEKEAVAQWERLVLGVGQELRRQNAGMTRDQLRAELIAGTDTEWSPPAPIGPSAVEGSVDQILKIIWPLNGNGNGHAKEAKFQLPELIKAEISILSGRQLVDQYQAIRREWLVDGFLAAREVSMWSGKVEAGKTTLIRTLVMCLVRELEFLGRQCRRSKVLYAMLDADGLDLTTEEFLGLGWNPDKDPVDFLIDPVFALRQDSLPRFYSKVMEMKPDLIVVDPFGRFQQLADFLGYETTYAMARISELAKQTNTHIALINHIPRGRDDSADAATAAFGSIAIAGGVNARFVCANRSGVYTLRTSKGKGGGFKPFDEEMTIIRDEDTHWCSLGPAYTWAAVARGLKPRVLEFINHNAIDEWMTGTDIAKELGVSKSLATIAAKMLAEDGYIRKQGKGKRGDPYQYMKKAPDLPEERDTSADPDLFN